MVHRLLQLACTAGLIGSGLLVRSRAGEVKAAGLDYRVTHWTAENGLPQNSVRAIVQTRDGYLWIGTLKGLARFDGMRFSVFDHANTPEMTHDSINDLAEDSLDRGLWIGTGEGLLRYRSHRFERYGLAQGVGNPVGNLCATKAGGVWFCCRWGQVGLARAGQIVLKEFGPDRASNEVHQLREEEPGQLLAIIGAGGEVVRLGADVKSPVRMNVPMVGSRCYSFFQDTDGTLWLCRDDGIWRGSGAAWSRVTTAAGPAGPRPERLYRTSDGQIWVTQIETERSSLNRFVDGRLVRFTAPGLPAELNVTRMLEDHEGNLWIGSTTGLFRLEPRRLRVYSRSDGMRNDNTLAVAEGTDGTIWIGTGGGVSRIRDGKVDNVPSPVARESWPRISVFLVDRQNRLWLGGP